MWCSLICQLFVNCYSNNRKLSQTFRLKTTQIDYLIVMWVRSPTQVSLVKVKVSARLNSFPEALVGGKSVCLPFIASVGQPHL